MTKPTSSRLTGITLGQFSGGRHTAAKDLDNFRKVVSKATQDPAKLRAIAIKAGIATPSGRLKKAYGG